MLSTRSFMVGLWSVAITLFLFTAAQPLPVQAAFTCVWTGAVDNTWASPENWAGCNGAIPQVDDTASITAVVGRPQPVLNGSTTIARLDINPTGALLAVGGATLTAGMVNLNGRFTGPGEIVVTSIFRYGSAPTVDWTNDGILDGGGKITLNTGSHGYITRQTDYHRWTNFTFENHGIVDPTDAAPYNYIYLILDSAVLDNYGIFVINGTFIDASNNSTIHNHAGGTLLATTYANVYTGLLNDGTFTVTNTDVVVCRGGTQNGAFNGTGSGYIGFGICYEGANIPSTWDFTATSSLTVPRVQFALPGSTINIHGEYGPIGTTTISWLWGTVTFHSDAAINSFGGELRVYGPTTVNADAPPNQYDLYVQGSTADFSYSGTINVAHRLECGGGGKLSGGGLLRVQNTGILYLGSCILDGKTLENEATSYTGASAGMTIQGLNGALIDNEGTFNLGAFTGISGDMSFHNHGTLIKNYNNTTTVSVPFQNTGAINITLGSIIFTSDVTIPAGFSSTIAGSITVGELVNEGTLTVTGTVYGDLTNRGTLNLSGTVTGDLVNEGLLSPGSSPGDGVVQGNFTQTSAGSLKIELSKDGSTPVLNPVAGVDYDQLVVSGTAVLAGELYLDAGETLALVGFQEFPFLTAAGGVSGSFTSQDLDDMIDPRLWALLQRPAEMLVKLNAYLYLPGIFIAP